MASAAMILRSAARSLRPRPRRRQSLDLLTRRHISSSVHSERHKCPPSEARPRDTVDNKRLASEKKEDVYERLSMKADKILDGIDRQTRLLQELKIQIEGNSELTEKPSSDRKSSLWSRTVIQKWRSRWKGF